MLTRLAIIGAGAVTREMLAVLAQRLPGKLEHLIMLVRGGKAEQVRNELRHACASICERFDVVDEVAALIDAKPGLVVEAAGHEAVAECVPPLLETGIETVVASTGALSDALLAERLAEAARRGGTRVVLSAGAVGGMDILSALSRSGIHSVDYTSRKPPNAWKGTVAESVLDLDALDIEAEFFVGTARQAASSYPKNANVAATIAMAGRGFDDTTVRLIADPAVNANIHSFKVISEAAEVTVRIEGKPSQANSKTSLPTVYSLVREVMNRVELVVS